MSSALTIFQHSYYVGNYISGVLYGVELVMYFMTLRALRRKGSVASRMFFGIYSTILLILLTIDISTNAIWGEMMWITSQGQPGGVPEFIVTQTSVWYETMGSTSVVALIFMGDALLIHRLYVIWGSNLWIIILPIVAYLAAFSLAIIELVLAGKPGGNFFGGRTINFGTPYYAITISMNIFITLLICYKLFRLSTAVGRALGKENARMYTSIASMLIESAAPYSLVGIMFLVPYARGSPTAISFGQVWAKLTCLSPQVIVLRVVSGKAWGKEVITQAESTVVFDNSYGKGIGAYSHGYSSHGTTVNATSIEKGESHSSNSVSIFHHV